jgi:hypothetical protein
MMVKEKFIFWPLLGTFVFILAFGFFSKGSRKEALEELSREIELATKKTVSKKRSERNKWDIDKLKISDTIGTYEAVLERSPFFRVVPEGKIKKVEPAVVETKPKKALFKYKGRVMMGSRVMVIIEDQGTGKSLFLQQGGTIGDFEVVHIDEKEVTLKQKDGEEIVLKSVKGQKNSVNSEGKRDNIE